MGEALTPSQLPKLLAKHGEPLGKLVRWQGVPADEGGDGDDPDLVSAESEAPAAMAADEVYAASFQSEDEGVED